MEQHLLTDEEIDKIHKIELELLIEFDRICRKNNIVYSIDGGTLLGAIRHGGFIPWDDDADVIMNRSEYEKLINVIDDELDTDKFYFQDMNRTKGYRWGYGKLRRKDTVFMRLDQEYMPYDQGVFMDVFVCDNVPNNKISRSICNFNSFLFRKIFYSKVGVNISKGLPKIAYLIVSKIPENLLKNVYCMYVKKRNKKHTDWVKCLTFPACNNTYGYKREWYEDVIEIEFEGYKFLGSRKHDEYLSFLYGNYMEFPPIEKRKIHPVSSLQLID